MDVSRAILSAKRGAPVNIGAWAANEWDVFEEARNLVLVYEPKYLRFFQARFERMG